jgi:hypothetical protein
MVTPPPPGRVAFSYALLAAILIAAAFLAVQFAPQATNP